MKERRWRGEEELLITAAVGNAKKVLSLLMALSKTKTLQYQYEVETIHFDRKSIRSVQAIVHRFHDKETHQITSSRWALFRSCQSNLHDVKSK